MEVMSPLPVPIAQSYWVRPGAFLAGEYPRALDEDTSIEKIRALEDTGVAAFIDLTEENEGLLPYAKLLTSSSHQRFPIKDVSVPTSKDAVVATLDAIDDHIRNNRMVYVHCWGGVGRTGVIVGCWLARHGEPGRSALATLQELFLQCPKSSHRASPETPAQEQFILDWRES